MYILSSNENIDTKSIVVYGVCMRRNRREEKRTEQEKSPKKIFTFRIHMEMRKRKKREQKNDQQTLN